MTIDNPHTYPIHTMELTRIMFTQYVFEVN